MGRAADKAEELGRYNQYSVFQRGINNAFLDKDSKEEIVKANNKVLRVHNNEYDYNATFYKDGTGYVGDFGTHDPNEILYRITSVGKFSKPTARLIADWYRKFAQQDVDIPEEFYDWHTWANL